MGELSPRLLDFDATRQPIPPRDAATVVVLRDAPDGLEVFCVRRHVKSGFLGGAIVFPGGKLDPSDLDPAWDALGGAPHPRGERFAGPTATARALAIAACRETFEEGAILPALSPFDDDACVALGAALRSGGTLAAALAARALRLDLGALVPFARWVTPEAEARRFDARFYLLALPAGQVGRHDQHETTMSFWGKPARILDRSARGEFFLAPPTSRALELLSTAARVEDAMELAERQSLCPICPRFCPADESGAPFLALPGDPAHPIAERYVEGPSRYVMREGRFVAEEPRPDPSKDVSASPTEGATLEEEA